MKGRTRIGYELVGVGWEEKIEYEGRDEAGQEKRSGIPGRSRTRRWLVVGAGWEREDRTKMLMKVCGAGGEKKQEGLSGAGRQDGMN